MIAKGTTHNNGRETRPLYDDGQRGRTRRTVAAFAASPLGISGTHFAPSM